MELLTNILLIAGMVIIAWFSYTMIKRNPQVFSLHNLNKSVFTLGILALFLIGVIAILVFLLKSG